MQDSGGGLVMCYILSVAQKTWFDDCDFPKFTENPPLSLRADGQCHHHPSGGYQEKMWGFVPPASTIPNVGGIASPSGTGSSRKEKRAPLEKALHRQAEGWKLGTKLQGPRQMCSPPAG